MSKTYRGRAPIPRPGGPMKDKRTKRARRDDWRGEWFDEMEEHEHVDTVTGEVIEHEHGTNHEGHSHYIDTGYEIVLYE